MPVWGSTLLGVAVGGFLTYLVAIRSERLRRRANVAEERRRTLATYLGRLYIYVGQVRQWPEELPPTPLQKIRQETLGRSRHVQTNDWVAAQRKMREVMGENLYEPLHRLLEAYADLQLMRLDTDVRSQVVATVDYVQRLAKDRSDTALAAWEPLRDQLLRTIKSSGDYAAIEAAAPAEILSGPDDHAELVRTSLAPQA